MKALVFVVALGLSGLAQASPSKKHSAKRSNEVAVEAAPKERDVPLPDVANAQAVRVTIGVTGPIAMQYTTFDLGGDFDTPLRSPWLLDAGLHLAVKSHRAALEPIAGIKRKWVRRIQAFALVPYALGGLGANLGFNRGSTDFGLALRGAGGASLLFSSGIGVTSELALELGPLVAPGAALQGAVRWNIGVDFPI